MEIEYVLIAVIGYAVAPYIYQIFLSLFLGWQYAKYAKKAKEKRKD